VKQKFIYPAFLLYAFLCFGLALVEVYKYPGVVAKFTHVDFSYFIYLLAIFSVFVKKPEKHKKIFILGAIFAVIFFIGITFVESVTYNNFVFSRFHINIGGSANLVSIFFVLLVPYYLIKRNLIDKVAILILVFWVTSNMLGTFSFASNKVGFQLKNLNYTYDEKMRNDWGEFYDCMKVIKINTPENSMIYLPPQSSVWQMEGNEFLVRYFLYPRGIKHFENIIEASSSANPYFVYSWGYYPGDRDLGAWPYEKFDALSGNFVDREDNFDLSIPIEFDQNNLKNIKTCGVIKPMFK